MATTSFQQILWTAAGASLGVFALAWLNTLCFTRFRTVRLRRSTETWQSVLEALAEAQRAPAGSASVAKLTRVLDAAADDEATPRLVAEALALRPNDQLLVNAVNASRLRTEIHTALLDDDPDRQITGLQLAGRLGQTDHLPLVLMLTVSPERHVARAAVQALELLDPTSALDLLFRALQSEGLWATGEILNLLRRGALEGWLAAHGEAHLADIVTLLTTLVQTETEPIRLACVDILTQIPHRSATQALGRVARTSGVVAAAAADALSATPSGRVLLAKLDLADEQQARDLRRQRLAGHR